MGEEGSGGEKEVKVVQAGQWMEGRRVGWAEWLVGVRVEAQAGRAEGSLADLWCVRGRAGGQ